MFDLFERNVITIAERLARVEGPLVRVGLTLLGILGFVVFFIQEATRLVSLLLR